MVIIKERRGSDSVGLAGRWRCAVRVVYFPGRLVLEPRVVSPHMCAATSRKDPPSVPAEKLTLTHTAAEISDRKRGEGGIAKGGGG